MHVQCFDRVGDSGSVPDNGVIGEGWPVGLLLAACDAEYRWSKVSYCKQDAYFAVRACDGNSRLGLCKIQGSVAADGHCCTVMAWQASRLYSA